MATLNDEEFGTVTLRRSAKASYVKIRIGTDGRLHASLPLSAPAVLVKRLIGSSRPELRTMLRQHQGQSIFRDGMQIGKSHHLICRSNSAKQAAVTAHGQQIIVAMPAGVPVESPDVQAAIRPAVIEALRKEAKSYLPKRLAFLAEKYGFSYQKIRFSHASGRWGSCTSKGTISLNIALMKLPFELIDYVLLHELSHTVQMNHSRAFWSEVERCDAAYAAHRRDLKRESPSI
jgi:predicted metal-dependent hydrolase